MKTKLSSQILAVLLVLAMIFCTLCTANVKTSSDAVGVQTTEKVSESMSSISLVDLNDTKEDTEIVVDEK